jgi:hypothetical protein
MTSQQQTKAIQADPSASDLLKFMVNKSMQRDCVDALADAETLCNVLRERCREMGIT